MAKKKKKELDPNQAFAPSGYRSGGGIRNVPHNLFLDIKRNKVVYILLAVILAYFAIFNYAPMVGLLMAFEKFSPVKGIFGSKWVGMKNFKDFFEGRTA